MVCQPCWLPLVCQPCWLPFTCIYIYICRFIIIIIIYLYNTSTNAEMYERGGPPPQSGGIVLYCMQYCIVVLYSIVCSTSCRVHSFYSTLLYSTVLYCATVISLEHSTTLHCIVTAILRLQIGHWLLRGHVSGRCQGSSSPNKPGNHSL